ncbi:pilin [Acinetobacter indicus]|uniref:pilin n=1 Tax=Acinetobacter indicus TaxID=756892 RepID=UPI0035BC6FFB
MIAAGASAKSAISEGFQTNGIAGVDSAAAAISKGSSTAPISKYVESISSPSTVTGAAVAAADAAAVTGIITLTTTADASLPTDAKQKTIVLVPYVTAADDGTAASLAAGQEGSIQWACLTSTNVQAKTRFPALATTITADLPAKYAPSECR